MRQKKKKKKKQEKCDEKRSPRPRQATKASLNVLVMFYQISEVPRYWPAPKDKKC